MKFPQKITLIIVVLSLLSNSTELWASKCTGSLFVADDVVHVTHTQSHVGSPRYYVNISIPDEHNKIPFSHMAISRGDIELSTNIETKINNGIGIGQVYATESELANWSVTVFYIDNLKKGNGFQRCRKKYVGMQSLEHNKN